MARARNLKPGYFSDAELTECDFWVRLLFAGLWTECDREGRIEDRPKQIKINIFPADNVDIDAGLAELDRRGLVLRYEVAGKRYVQVRNFVKHQQPHYKEPASAIPPPPGHVDSPYVTFGVPHEQRARILNRDSHKCVACGSADDLTMDHMVARSKGGSGDDENLQTLCRRCNSAKNNRDAAETSARGRPVVGQSSANESGALAPDSGLLTPSSLIPDSGLLTADPGPGADAPGTARAAPPSPVGSPFGLLESLCETLGQDVAVLSEGEKKKQLAAGKRLVAAGWERSTWAG